MAVDARGGPSAGEAVLPRGTVVGATQQGTAVAWARGRAERPRPTTRDHPCTPRGDLETILLSRGWVETALDWQWRADGRVHARVLTSRDGACLVLGDAQPGDWSGHLGAGELLARLGDVERHRAGAPLPVWAVTDALLADLTLANDPTWSGWHAWTVERGDDHTLTMTTHRGPMADRRPRITFEPRPARDAVRSPQSVRLHLAGHPVRSFWAHRLLPLAHLVQGHPEPGTELCDVTDQVDAAWDLHAVLEPRGGWCFTGTCHGTWRRGHPLAPVTTIALSRTPGEVVVDLCGDRPGVIAATARLAAPDLPRRLDEIEGHRPGVPAPTWSRAAEPARPCSPR